MMAGVDDGCAAVFLVGWHAKRRRRASSRTRSTASRSRACSSTATKTGEAGALRRRGSRVRRAGGAHHRRRRFVAEAAPLFRRRRRRSPSRRAHGQPGRDSLSPAAACAAIEAGAREAAAACRDAAHRAGGTFAAACACRRRPPRWPTCSRCCRSSGASSPRRSNSLADDAPRSACAEQPVGDVVHAALSANRPTPVVVAYCRAGFEPEASADLARLMEAAGTAGRIDANSGEGFVTASLEAFDAKRWSSAFDRHPPVFVRGSFIGTGPHALVSPADAGRPDRVTPIVDAIAALPQRASPACGSSFLTPTKARRCRRSHGRWLRVSTKRCANWGSSMPDTRCGSTCSCADRNTAHVGTSSVTTGSPWPMGIPRLRMPHGAPSRSTAEARRGIPRVPRRREAELLRPGMRAVDLGAAPGGWTWQLAHRGLKVIAVDNGALKGDVAIDPLRDARARRRPDVAAAHPRRLARLRHRRCSRSASPSSSRAGLPMAPRVARSST